MKAIVISRFGGPEVLELRDVPDPVPGPDEVLVRVRATAVNRADLLQRMGRYPAPPDAPADVPGIEIAGVVEAAGARVIDLAVGDRVFGVVGGGGYAERVVAHARALAKIPDGLDDDAAGAVPEAFVTAHDALVQAGLRPGDRVLVHAAGSGVGTAAIQIARAFGAFVVGTSRSAEKLARARPLGLDAAVVPAEGRFADEVLAATGGAGADVVLDLVGGPVLEESLRAVATRGRIVLVGLLAGAQANVDLGLVLRKRIAIVGTVLRSRPIEERIAVTRRFAAEIVPLLAKGAVRAVVDGVFPLADARAAHERLASNAPFGKVVLRT